MPQLKSFTMPKWGIEMSEGTVAEWMVGEDVPFTKGTVLALIETDKITNEIEAEADGRFVRLIAKAGDTLPVGALLGILSQGESANAAEIDAMIEAFRPADASFDGPTASTPAAIEHVGESALSIPGGLAISPAAWTKALQSGVDAAAIRGSGRGGRVTAQDIDQALAPQAAPMLVGPFPLLPEGKASSSPLARRLAAEHGVMLDGMEGTGPRGRISKADVIAAVAARSQPLASAQGQTPDRAPARTAGSVAVVPMSSMRRTIARRLSEAKSTIPHFYVRRRVRADRLLAARAGLVGSRPSINDYLVRACALALMEVPQVNIQVAGNDIHRFASADIAVAVATERGLVTPIVFGAEVLGLTDIAAEMIRLVQRAKSGRLAGEDFTGGSFTLSNLGGFGVEQFDAIINPPQGAILAVGTARPEPIEDDGALRIAPVLHLSLSCDHRAIDGADAGAFLAAVSSLIERPELLA